MRYRLLTSEVVKAIYIVYGKGLPELTSYSEIFTNTIRWDYASLSTATFTTHRIYYLDSERCLCTFYV